MQFDSRPDMKANEKKFGGDLLRQTANYVGGKIFYGSNDNKVEAEIGKQDVDDNKGINIILISGLI